MNKVHYCYEISIYGDTSLTKVYPANGTEGYAITPCGKYTSFSSRQLVGEVYTFEIPPYDPPKEVKIATLEHYAQEIKNRAIDNMNKELDPVLASLRELKALEDQSAHYGDFNYE